jgi:aryl-alcohol dehydrogenase-like predicted oxidoreductase
MRYKILGTSGLRVSELCLGTMTFGDEWGWGAPKEECHRIFDAYANAGGNFIDTANRYTEGTAEKFVGEFIAADRDHFVVATKYTLFDRKGDPNFSGNHRKNMRRSVAESLQRLNLQYIDLLWVHIWDFTTPVDEVMRGLDDLVRSGQVLHIGISDTPAWIVSHANTLADLRGWSRFVGLQVEYSLIERSAERELLPMAQSLQLAVTPWGVLSAGILSGKYNDPKGERGRVSRWGDVSQRDLAIAQAATEVAHELGCTPSQVATNWVRQRPGSMIPILGARTLAQIEDTLGCLAYPLTDAQLAKLNEASAIPLGVPHDMLRSARDLYSGGTWSDVDNPYWAR